ncbi:MAG: TetR/AcrR family transcriptional regulator [Pseudomonadota bacterium]
MSKSSPSARRPVGRPRSDGKPHLTRERVFAACAQLIAEHGYAGTGIRMMAQTLDASPASIFNLFGSKDAILNELIAWAAGPSLRFYKALAAVDAPPAVKLYKSLYEEALVVNAADRNYVALFYLPELRTAAFGPAQSVRARMVAHYERLLRAGARAGTISAPHLGLAAEQVFQLTETRIIAGPAMERMRARTTAAATATFCLQALLTEPGELTTVRGAAGQLRQRIEYSTDYGRA